MNQQRRAPTAILLAAGQSSRFGSDKLLHELTIAGKSQTLIQHTLELWFSVFDEIYIVIRPDNQLLKNTMLHWAGLHQKKINLIECQQAELGMGHSLKAAITATSQAYGWVIGLADMPLIPQEVLQKICQNLKQGAAITAPYYDERRGHPVGFNFSYQAELLTLEGDTGAKNLLQRDEGKIYKIETDDVGILKDIDGMDDVRVIEHLGKT